MSSQMSNLTEMSAEDLLTLIEEADRVLDQKITAEKTELAERVAKLQKLEARRARKMNAAKPPRVPTRATNGKANGKADHGATASEVKLDAVSTAQ